MKNESSEAQVHFTAEKLTRPLLEKLNALAERLVGIQFLIVYPKAEGWGQLPLGGGKNTPGFCRAIQQTAVGAEHCRMCHLMMAIAAGSGHSVVQRCHGGVSALVCALAGARDRGMAVLTSCVFIGDVDPATSWEVARKRGEKLGVDLKALREAYDHTPRLTGEKLELADALLDVFGEALREVRARLAAESAAVEGRSAAAAEYRDIETAVRRELREALSTLRHAREPRATAVRNPPSALMSIVSDLIVQKPSMPFSVGAIAAACRMTPNHFSHLFHQHHRQCFSEFLTEQRLGLARELLKDLTLTVSEVAFRAGFHDAGYFARRFRQKHRISPRQWRQRLEKGEKPASKAAQSRDGNRSS
jgi:AraC-like DNA-binding protein